MCGTACQHHTQHTALTTAVTSTQAQHQLMRVDASAQPTPLPCSAYSAQHNEVAAPTLCKFRTVPTASVHACCSTAPLLLLTWSGDTPAHNGVTVSRTHNLWLLVHTLTTIHMHTDNPGHKSTHINVPVHKSTKVYYTKRCNLQVTHKHAQTFCFSLFVPQLHV